MSRWISVEEKLPEIHKNVLTYRASDGEIAEDERYNDGGFLFKDVTHWMPLPRVPHDSDSLPMTVADHIRDMSDVNDEELADKIVEALPLLYDTRFDPSEKFCDNQGGCTACGECCDEYRRECILRWLRGAWQDE